MATRKYAVNHPARTVHRIVSRELNRCARTYAGGDLLDIGCGEKPRLPMFAPFVRSHVGVDHEGSVHGRDQVDITATAYDIPVQDKSFKTVLCTAVLEHLEEPQRALDEAYRVLSPGGIAIYTVPLFWHIHEAPRDFFRFTEYGLRYLFETSGFSVIELKALAGFWVTFCTELGYYLSRFRRGAFKPLVDLVVIILNWAGPRLDRGLFREENFTWMYLVVARR